MSWQTFWIEPDGMVRRGLRRYHSSSDDLNPCPAGTYHNAVVPMDVVPDENSVSGDLWPHDDPLWPKTCAACEYAFIDEDAWQLSNNREYIRRDTGETMTLFSAPVGAMWDSHWMSTHYKAGDGIALTVMLPGLHPWLVDSRASNCTKPEDKVHKCWVRHGDPRTERVTVDKNGLTCDAGAGSIMVPGYHGFLHDGVLTD